MEMDAKKSTSFEHCGMDWNEIRLQSERKRRGDGEESRRLT
jgi:hypothetical protein